MEHFKIHRRILRLKDRLDTCYYELGGLLREVFHQQYYLELGFDHFEDYLREILEFSIRKAFYLMSIWDKVNELSIPPEKLRQIGWTKMKEVVRVATPEDLTVWLARAEQLTTQELQALIGQNETDNETPKPFVIHFYQAQRDVFVRALELAHLMTGSESRGYQAEMIAAEFLATYESMEEEESEAREGSLLQASDRCLPA
jgi:hypothetical protein